MWTWVAIVGGAVLLIAVLVNLQEKLPGERKSFEDVVDAPDFRGDDGDSDA